MDTSKWKWFPYDEIFDIKSFRGDTLQDLMEGDIPYISATEDNNGINGYIDSDIFCEGNKITVSRNGSVGVAFYQPQNFYPSPDDVRIFALKNYLLTPYIALFLCVLIEKERYRYTYGRKFGTGRMKASLIKLPVTSGGTPDWKYMEDFVKDQIIPQLPKKAQKVWLQKYDITPQQDMKMRLNTDEWKWFLLKDLFQLKRGKRLTEYDREKGDIPFVTAGVGNNGVSEYISNEVELYKNAITIDMFGCAFYRNYTFACDDNILVLTNDNLNYSSGLFIASIIDRDKYKFAYGRQYRQKSFNKHVIKLPVTPSGEPDWQFMEDYIKSLPYSKNIEPSDPNEVVDEVIEMKKELIKMRKQLEAQQASQEVKIIGGNVTYIDNSKNYNIQK